MSTTVNILEGSTFVTSDDRGDIAGTPTTPHGLFAFDTRFLSRWALTVDGQSPSSLSVDDLRYNAAQFFLAPSTGTTYIDAPMSVIRRREIGQTMTETIIVLNHSPEPLSVHLRLEVDADFADLFEVKDALDKKGERFARVEDGTLVLGYRRDQYERETRVTSRTPAQMSPDALEYDVAVEPNGEWSTDIEVLPALIGFASDSMSGTAGDRADDLEQWVRAAPKLTSDWRPMERIYEKSIVDLAALRFHLPRSAWQVMPAAGLPWFMAPFGRDSLITSYQALPFVPALAEMTLRTLAAFQGKEVDDFRDEEPGKILHELRFGEMTAFEERPHSPYFGSADSTTLWLILLDEYERWSGRVELVRELEPNARAAIAWIDDYGDRDGDGYIEYDRRNTDTGLENQCWKDSWNSILFSDGTLAPLPRATCELQGYAYDAKIRCARLAREIWGDQPFAERLEREAADLKARFNRDFWIADRGFFALALDGQKRQVDSLTSNIGHLLWSGIVDDDKAPDVVRDLMGDDLFSGWGVRTMAASERGYNPIGYHVGTVWPHDNSLIAMGLRRYGYNAEAARLSQGILQAATYFHDRLPEAFAGYEREFTHYPVEYPTACSPQAWATGAPLLLTQAMLGLEPQGARLTSNPVLPPVMSHLEVADIPGRWGLDSAGAHAADTILAALATASAEAPGSIAELFDRMDKRVGSVNGRKGHTSIRFDLDDGESWRVAVDDGKLDVGRSTEDADCVIETNESTLREMLAGRQKAQTAVLSGKVRVRGDMAIAAKIGNLF
jgi:glycogen debranching enzyme/putative sterol carrier protein